MYRNLFSAGYNCLKLAVVVTVSIFFSIFMILYYLLFRMISGIRTKPKSSSGPHSKALVSFPKNCKVVLKNLGKAHKYNGAAGIVIAEAEPRDGRLSVKLTSNSKILKVRLENVELPADQRVSSSIERTQKKIISPLQMGANRWAPGSLDPSKLRKWAGDASLERAFSDFQFSLNESLASRVGVRPPRGTDPAHDLKETLLVLARAVDSGEGAAMLVQDESQDEGIAIVVAAVLGCDSGTDIPQPLLVVQHWSESADSPSIDRSMRSFLAAVRPNTAVSRLSVAPAEIAALRALLSYNAERLDPGWVAAQAVPDAFSLSYLTPLGRPTAERERPDCACGAKAPKLRCQRCGLKWYCSKECQVPCAAAARPGARHAGHFALARAARAECARSLAQHAQVRVLRRARTRPYAHRRVRARACTLARARPRGPAQSRERMRLEAPDHCTPPTTTAHEHADAHAQVSDWRVHKSDCRSLEDRQKVPHLLSDPAPVRPSAPPRPAVRVRPAIGARSSVRTYTLPPCRKTRPSRTGRCRAHPPTKQGHGFAAAAPRASVRGRSCALAPPCRA